MGWSVKVGQIFGIDLKIHVTFVLILIFGAFFYGGNGGILYGLLVTIALFGIVLLHELGHSLAALWFKIPVKDIILLPIGGVARLERMPREPWQELIIALAGPAVNVALMFLLTPVLLILVALQSGPVSLGLFTEASLTGFLMFLLMANISLAVFNMIPAFPLDGGRVFRAGLGFFTDYARATRIAVSTGQVLAVLMGILGLWFNQFSLVLVAIFIYFIGGQEGRSIHLESQLRQAPSYTGIDPQRMALTSHATVVQVLPAVLRSGQPAIAIVDPHDYRFVGWITRHQIMQAMAQGQGYLRLSEMMHRA